MLHNHRDKFVSTVLFYCKNKNPNYWIYIIKAAATTNATATTDPWLLGPRLVGVRRSVADYNEARGSGGAGGGGGGRGGEAEEVVGREALGATARL